MKQNFITCLISEWLWLLCTVSGITNYMCVCVCFSTDRESAGWCVETAEGKPPAGARKTSTSDRLIKTAASLEKMRRRAHIFLTCGRFLFHDGMT